MKAVRCHAWGTPDQLTIDEIESPSPKAGEVKIRTAACGVYYGDILMIAGKYQLQPPFPFVPGTEVAGEIIEVGPDVETFKIGDRVAAMGFYGTFAEEVILPTVSTFHIPDSMDYETAAGFPLNYGTSYIALVDRGKLQPGENLLVHGSAGGVGLTAVQIGKALGATVIATASTAEKLELVKSYGADHLINYQEESFKDRVKEITGGKGADVIYDPVGGNVFDQSLRCINWKGRVLVIGFASGTIPSPPVNLMLVKNMSVVGVFYGAYTYKEPQTLRQAIQTLTDWYEEGKISPYVSARFPLESVADAMNMIAERRAQGKVILTVS